MSFTYFKFLFVNTVKKKSIWITWALFLLTCTAFLIILPVFAQMNTLQVWSNTTMAVCQTFMGMVAGLFTAVLAINIFKDTNEDGTELIVISKPISRFKLVMSKFALFGFYCLLINLTAVIISAFTYFLPRTEHEFYVGLLVSMFIGNLVTFGVFGSISILMTVKFAKVGIIVANVLISLVFLIFQTLTLFVFPTPLKELDNQYMSTSTYIIHKRDVTTGEYTEDEVMKFTPSVPENQTKHPCQATNWHEMENYWKNDILAKDPTPVLNVTDLASQLALTYMSYQTDNFARRQADRMFSWSRFYDYDLTSPASPELIDNSIKNKQSLDWIYSDWQEISIDIPETEEKLTFYLLSEVGFDGIPPLTGTRLRGYANEIPIGSVRSQDQLFSNEVYFEKDQWQKYFQPFDLMYDVVYDWENYKDLYSPDTISPDDYASAFMLNSKALKHYYEVVWSCLMGQIDSELYPVKCEDQQKLTELKKYGPTYFDIHNVFDLNERFIQFKNYVYWKALAEQQKAIAGDYGTEEESAARASLCTDPIIEGIDLTYKDLWNLLGVDINQSGSYNMMAMKNWEDKGLLVQNSQAPNLDYMHQAFQKAFDSTADIEKKVDIGRNSAYSHFKKALRIFKTTVETDEDYLFDSLTKPDRQWKYTGRAYSVTTTWYPNVNGILKDLIELESNIPVGQNMQLFFYDTTPKLKYWVFSIIWGSISLALFTGGIIVYNKYDVK